MQINKIKTTNFNTQNPNFKAIKKIKFSNGYINRPSQQESLINALKQSNGAKEFFDKFDGNINFTTKSHYGSYGDSCIDSIMQISYKVKDKFMPLTDILHVTSENDLKEATVCMCNNIKKLSYEDFQIKNQY